MTFKVNVSKFCKSLKNLSLVQSYNNKNNSKRTLVNISKNQLLFEAIAPEFSLQETVELINETDVCFSFEIDIKLLERFVITVKEEEVSVKVDSERIELCCNERKFEQRIFKSSIKIEKLNLEQITAISTKQIQQLKDLCFAITPQSYSLALNTVRLLRKGSGYEAMATNGYILTRDLILKLNFERDELLLPKNSIECASKIFNDENLNSSDSSTHLKLSNNNSFFQIRTVDLNYIETKGILPTRYKFSFELDRKLITDFLSLLNSLTRSELSILEIEVISGECILRSKRSSNISMEQSFKVGEIADLNVSFNGKFLYELLDNFNDDSLRLSFNNAISPFLIKSNSMNSSKDAIILPMRL
jgi:DNA polymerase III sliding clamp (beta) subunit (PCNA family)